MGRFWQLNRIIKNRKQNGNFKPKTIIPMKPSYNSINNNYQGYIHEYTNIELNQSSILNEISRFLSKLYKKD